MVKVDTSAAERHFRRLLKIAKSHRVQVHFVPSLQLSWEGLYLLDGKGGPGIALREGMLPEWRAWVLAHELGHHFASLSLPLFAPFAEVPPVVRPANHSKKRRRLDAAEEFADDWAASTLIDEDSWCEAEDATPLRLDHIIGSLGLPLPAAVAWEHRRRRHQDLRVCATVPISPAALDGFTGACVGRGGHQSLFRRLKGWSRSDRIRLSFNDFSLARERALTVEGGWRNHYETLLAAIEPVISEAGGVTRMFRLKH